MKSPQTFLIAAGFLACSAISAFAYYVSPNGAYQAGLSSNGRTPSISVADAITGKELAKTSLSLYAADKIAGAGFTDVKIQWAPNSRFFVFSAVHAGRHVFGVISGTGSSPFERVTNLDASADPKLVDLVVGAANDVIATVRDSNGAVSHTFWRVKASGLLEPTAAL